MQRLGALNAQHRHPPSTVVISYLLELWGSHFWGLHGIFQEEWNVDTDRALWGVPIPPCWLAWVPHPCLLPFASAQVLCLQ